MPPLAELKVDLKGSTYRFVQKSRDSMKEISNEETVKYVNLMKNAENLNTVFAGPRLNRSHSKILKVFDHSPRLDP
jgi:hypothetical protein